MKAAIEIENFAANPFPAMDQADQASSPLAESRGAAPYRWGFVLFVLLNAILFVRPGEIVPAIGDLPIYLVLILLCLVMSLPAVFGQLSFRALALSPATLCVVGLIVPIFLSNAVHGDFSDAKTQSKDFLKIIIYYLLMVGLVTTTFRLKFLLLSLVIFITAVAGLAILQYHEIIDIPALTPYGIAERGADADMSDPDAAPDDGLRLRGTGIFNDPNDMSLILVTAMVVVVHFLLNQNRFRLLPSLLCVAVVAVLGFAFVLTKSRGGFMALMTAALAYIFSRYPRRRAIWMCVLMLPVLLVAVAGRQTNFDLENSDDSAQGRIQIWRDGIALFKGSPILGIGSGQFGEEVGYVAHNSYVHCFAEMGVVGGILFIGCLYLPLSILVRQKLEARQELSAEVRYWWPCILALLAGYAAGIISLSRPYVESTYVIVGLGVAYCGFLARERPASERPLSPRLAREVSLVALGWLGAIYVFVRIFAQ